MNKKERTPIKLFKNENYDPFDMEEVIPLFSLIYISKKKMLFNHYSLLYHHQA